MSPEVALYRQEKRKAEQRRAKILAELCRAHTELRSPKRARPERTEEFRAHRREIQQAYRAGKRLRPMDVRA